MAGYFFSGALGNLPIRAGEKWAVTVRSNLCFVTVCRVNIAFSLLFCQAKNDLASVNIYNETIR